MSIATLQVVDGVGLITIEQPSVESLATEVRRALDAALRTCLADGAVEAIVLTCTGRAFFAGADSIESGAPPERPHLRDVLDGIESSTKPVIAAIQGDALGTGLELALACHYRIAAPSAKVGFPAVGLGLMPAAGGTQRLTRLVGPEKAMDILCRGAAMAAPRALELGVIDAVASDGPLRDEAVRVARRMLSGGTPPQRARDRVDAIAAARGQPEIYANFLAKNAPAFRGLQAPFNIVKAIEAAMELEFADGMKREAELFRELQDGTESKARRHYALAERETARIPDIGPDVQTLPIRTVGVVGAGTMGGGIAMNFLNAGMPVTLVEMNEAALGRGLATIRKNYENSAKKGRMTTEAVEQRMAAIRPSTNLASLGDVDLVIEAVYEEMQIKKDLFAKIDAIARPGTILASNTSFLDLDEIAAATRRPADVVGLHFFSPANVMRLLEVVQGASTRKEIVATAVALAATIAKVPVLSRVGYGFIANRVMAKRMTEAEALVLEGPTPGEIDRAIYEYGFAMGPFQMIDLVGLDVVGRDIKERTLSGDLVKLGRLGQKTGGGYYDYDEKRNPTPSAIAAGVIGEFAAFKGVRPSGSLPAAEIVARLLYPVVNEGAKVLEEGIALRASDIDVACILGYGWPLHTGGPMFWADTVGLPDIVEGLRARGLQPASLLVQKAANGGTFSR